MTPETLRLLPTEELDEMVHDLKAAEAEDLANMRAEQLAEMRYGA